jgi:hypothetical protein
MVQDTIHYYDQMTSIVAPALKQKWEKEILAAESRRLGKPSVMDIIGAQDMNIRPSPIPAEPPRKDMEWLDLALAMEERQYMGFCLCIMCLLLMIEIELIFRTRFAALKRSHVKRPDQKSSGFGRFSLRSSFFSKHI